MWYYAMTKLRYVAIHSFKTCVKLSTCEKPSEETQSGWFDAALRTRKRGRALAIYCGADHFIEAKLDGDSSYGTAAGKEAFGSAGTGFIDQIPVFVVEVTGFFGPWPLNRTHNRFGVYYLCCIPLPLM